MTRRYLPVTLDVLADAWRGGGPLVGLDVVLAASEAEDDEYAALMTAADVAADSLDGPGRRVVVVAEGGSGDVPGTTAAWRDVVAVHADPADRPAGADPDEDLAWYGVQEVPTLLP